MFSNRCLEPPSPSVGKKSSSRPATAASILTQEDLQQFGKRQEGAWDAKRQKRKVSVEQEGQEEQEEGNRCLMPDMSQFVEKRIKVEDVGIKMVQDLTMDDFIRLVRVILT